MKRIIYAGTPEFAVPALAALINTEHQLVAVYTQPDRPAGRGRKLTASPVKQLALQHDIPVEQPVSLRDVQAQQHLISYQADLMVVAAYGLILPSAILTAPALGCINIHASLLPRWRGAAPIHRAILAGDQLTGITLMQMDQGLDTGAMLASSRIPIDPGQTAATLHDSLAVLGAELLIEHLPGILQGELLAEAQDEALVTYAAKLEKAEATIDWQHSAEQIQRQVCAFNPWPVAQTQMNDKVLRIWQAHALPDTNSTASAGEVIACTPEGVDVATGEGGTLRILRLQLPGGKPLAVRDFVNAHNLQGTQLGQPADAT